MCGIAGIVWQQNDSEKAAAIRKMTDAMAHRGPDAGEHFVDDEIALGHRRLSIIDLSPEANQPMWDHSRRYVLTFNGEIYNFRKVKAELEGYPFRTSCDSEVILAAYSRWGVSFWKNWKECSHWPFGMLNGKNCLLRVIDLVLNHCIISETKRNSFCLRNTWPYGKWPDA